MISHITKQPGHDDAVDEALMLTVKEVARMLNCSERHVYRLESKGMMPKAARPGDITRWHRIAIAEWIEACCPALAV